MIRMSAATTMSIYYELPKERKTAKSSLSLMKMCKKTIKTVKRKSTAIKKGLYKGKYSILVDCNYIFRNLMNIQSPHPELDPRHTYSSIYFQSTHPSYSHSVLRMLSYALSSSLNNYHTLLKNHGIVSFQLSKSLEENKEQVRIENSFAKPKKKKNFIKQKKELVLQMKNETKKVAQSSENISRVQESIQTYKITALNENRESKHIIQNIEIIKSSKQTKQASKAEKKEDFSDNSDFKLIEQPKLPKFGIETKQMKLIRENLLMRQVKNLPIKQRAAGMSREMRSLFN